MLITSPFDIEFKSNDKGIYAIINTKVATPYCSFGKPYIGQTVSKMGISGRLSGHVNRLRADQYNSYRGHENLHLWNAWKKYGEDAFKFMVLETFQSPDNATERESYWIDKFKSNHSKYGYNIRPSAGSNIGVILKPLNEDIIYNSILEHYKIYKKYPNNKTKTPVPFYENRTWRQIDYALLFGYCGLKGGSSLARFIADKFCVVNRTNCLTLNHETIFDWSYQFLSEYRRSPNKRDGIIKYAGECFGNITWSQIDSALNSGSRGLVGSISLHKLLQTNQDFRIYTYEEACEAVRVMGIKSYFDYKNRYKEDYKLVARPDAYYKKYWISFGDFFGVVRPKNIRLTGKYLTLQEASEAAKSLGIKNCKEYRSKHKLDKKLHWLPKVAYKSDWQGWDKFLQIDV